MGGGLIQLVAYGAQDVYLTGNPQITFFKVVYKRHTNFSTELIPQVFNGNPDFGQKINCTIARKGDLLHRIYLYVEIETSANYDINDILYENTFGFIDNIELEIGGQVIDKQYGDWLNIWTSLTHNIDKISGLYNLIKPSYRYQDEFNSNNVRKVNQGRFYIPLQFWFNKDPGLALPLVALQYHEIKLTVTMGKEINVRKSYNVQDKSTYPLNLTDAYLYCEYIYLDTDERRRFCKTSHEYLIEQVQFNGKQIVNSNTTISRIELNFNHPVKELIWVIQDQYADSENIDREFLIPTSSGITTDNNIIFNYSRGCGSIEGSNIAIKDQMDSAVLQLNGIDRFKRRDGFYFRQVQRYQYHTGLFYNPYIYMYSFGLNPEGHQPSGTLNFSRVDSAILNMTLTSSISALNDGSLQSDTKTANKVPRRVRVYGINYNILRIMSGMAGLAYSN
tara:strand:+ start:657 stop:2000 length:1344 start_codon:yes stop_codon:yes gene_type:complete